LVALEARRYRWFVGLALAVFVIVSGQVRTFDVGTAAPETDGDGVSPSIMDDTFVALPLSADPDAVRVPGMILALAPTAPPERLLIPDLFRPPRVSPVPELA
jgi:hypothetical protein